MRSFASALSLGRGGRSDNTSTTSAHSATAPLPRLVKARSTSLFAKAPKTPVETTGSVLHSRPDLTPGSSCSSDGSASLRTPEDEHMMAFPKFEERRRWSSWFGWRKPSDKDVLGEPMDASLSTPQTESVNRTPNGEHGPSMRVSRHIASDTDDDEDSSSESSEYHEGSSAISPRAAPSRATTVQARANLRTLLRNSLSPPPSPPPVVEMPSALFPRSSASLGSSQHSLSLESTMHIRKMLWRLDHQTLSKAEAESIASLARRPQPKVASRNGAEKKMDDEMISYASMRVGRFSRGLRKWTSRPCFEQRFLVWMPDEKGDVVGRGVMGVERDLAVFDLEFSEGTEALAGLELDEQSFERNLFPPPPTPKGLVLNSIPRKHSPPRGSPRKASFHSSPSPLRLEHAALAEPVLSPVSPLSSVASSAQTLTLALDVSSSDPPKRESEARMSATPRGIHFARGAEEADEDIPLGYTLQAKKRREEKERFLRAEREKRAKEASVREAAERQKRLEAEQRRAVEEQKRKEEERRRVDEEKILREERMKAKYNEEVAASRRRRESARLGMDSFTNIREMHQREDGQTYSRPAYDKASAPTRRMASEPVSPTDSSVKDSSNTSRPASVVESVQDKRRSMAPTYNAMHSSVENLPPPMQRRQTSGMDIPQQQQPARPPSITSSSSRPASFLRTQSAPNQVPMMPYPMMPVIPPVPPIPVWSMPLLPPNAPFMMQQYSRSPSPGSNPHSQTPSPSSSPSHRQSAMQPPHSSSRRQSTMQSSPSPSRSQHAVASSSRPRHSRYPSSDGNAPQHSAPSRSSNSLPQRPSRSTSYSPLQPTAPQPIYRDERSRKSHYGSSTNLVHSDTKRRTTMM